MKENMNERNNEQTIIKVLSIPEDLPAPPTQMSRMHRLVYPGLIIS